jgi:hypothetical protein
MDGSLSRGSAIRISDTLRTVQPIIYKIKLNLGARHENQRE